MKVDFPEADEKYPVQCATLSLDWGRVNKNLAFLNENYTSKQEPFEWKLNFSQYHFHNHQVFPLESGFEVVAGSTRMKAGSSTKKILNFISSAAMIRLGKVYGSYIIDAACINQKLVNRAKNILFKLYNISEYEGYSLLEDHDLDLRNTIMDIESAASRNLLE